MAKTFTITTTAPDTIKTDAKGHAEAVYTVTNTSSRPVRGMAKATALDSTKQEWLQITGETDRDFAAGSTQQFVVTFDAPPPPTPKPGASTPAADTAAGDKYGFRLVVASATNPDEDFTEGQTIRVELPKAPTPTNGGKPFPKWIFIPIAIVALLVIGIVIWLVVRGGKDEPQAFLVPDVAGVAEADAQSRLETECPEGTGCLVVTVAPIADNTVAKGNAVGTDPVAGTEVPVGAAVTLVVSSGPEVNPVETYKLPAVANVAEATAKGSLEKGCKKQVGCVQVEVNRVADSKVPAGIALRTEPEAETEVEVGSPVVMFVSKGPDRVTIVNVVNKTADSAMDLLEKSCEPAPCLDVEVTRIADNKVARGLVIRTVPIPGASAVAGSKVMLFVSGGPDEVTIPAVRGKTVAEARQLLANACKPTPCLQATVVTQHELFVEAGKAISTTPLKGGAVKIGSNIVLNVSLGPDLRTVGTYTSVTEALARQRIIKDGFTVGTIKKKPGVLSSWVIGQAPKAGLKRIKGSKIDLTVMVKF